MQNEKPSHTDIDSVLDEQQQRWQQGDFVAAESLIAESPELFDDKSVLMDLVYAEVVLRENRQQSPTEDEYVARFPKIASEISRQFQIHRCLGEENRFLNACSTIREAGDPNDTQRRMRFDPREIEGFRLIDIIGSGACGIVYRAIDEKLNRTVAMKFLHAGDATNRVRAKLFQRESQAAARLEHPGIVRVLQVSSRSETPWIAMEHIKGGTLQDKLRTGPLSAKAAAKTGIKVAEAIEHAHQKGIIHRDIKPGNVFLEGENDRVCVGDFGLARQLDVDQSLHASGAVIGTPAYMSPEQARGEKADERSDIYSIGALLYEMLTGRPPFQSATAWEVIHEVLNNDPISPRRLIESIPRDLETICLKCMEKNVSRRYQTSGEVAAEIQKYLDGKPLNARPVGWAARTWKLCRRNPVVSILTTTVALALLTTAIVAVRSRNRVADSLKKTSLALNETALALEDSKEKRSIAVESMTEMISDVYTELEKHKASLPARKGVLEHAIRGLEKIVESDGQRNDTRSSLAYGYDRLAQVISLEGDFVKAEENWLRAIGFAHAMTSVGKEHGYLAEEQVARVKLNLCRMYTRSDQPEKGIGLAHEVNDLIDQRLADDTGDPQLQFLKLCALELLFVTDLSPASIPIGEQARELGLGLEADDEVDHRLQAVTSTLGRRYEQIGKLGLAKERYAESITIINHLLERTPDAPSLIADYNIQAMSLASLKILAMEYDTAEDIFRKSILNLEDLLETDTRPSFQLKYAATLQQLAACLYAQGKLDEALEVSRRHISTIEKVVAVGPEYNVQFASIAQGRALNSNIILYGGDIELACEEFAELIEAHKSVPEKYIQPPFIELLQSIHDSILAIKNKQEIGDNLELQNLRLLYDAWQGSLHGDFKIIKAREAELSAAVQSGQSPAMKMLTASFHSRAYAKWYEHLNSRGDSDPEVIEQVWEKTMNSIALYATMTGPYIHATEPEFSAIRKSANAAKQFALP